MRHRHRHRQRDAVHLSRRDALSMIAGAALGSAAPAPVASRAQPAMAKSFRVRTLTAGTPVKSFADTHAIEASLDFLGMAKKRFEAAGYVVQTIRVALNPLLVGAAPSARQDAMPRLRAIDALAAARGALVSIGPVFSAGDADADIGAWAAGLAAATKTLSFSGAVASTAQGIHRGAAEMAAQVIASLTHAAPAGLANFRFAAAALIPAGTPFFPVAFHHGPASLGVGLETPNLVRQAFSGAADPDQASERLRQLLDAELPPVESLARAIAADGRRQYLGIDTSPAPGRDSSIGEALESLTRQPFGAASTLQACAAVTAAIKRSSVSSCGYGGLMLPILEDPVLADRARQGRISISELLLYSTVCGTGLDLVPLAGDTSPDALARVIGDVATLAVRLNKPLSARLFPVPGKRTGDPIDFTDPLLCPSNVMPLEA